MSDLSTSVDRFEDLRVLVLGEAVLDGWLRGPARLSREAPVPVVSLREATLSAGAAANAAVNAATLGARVRMVSVTGDDADAAHLRRLLHAEGVDASGVVVDPDRRTLAKRRVVAGTQMVVRLDEGDADRPPPPVRDALRAALRTAWADVDVVLVGDYDLGLLGDDVVDEVGKLQAEAPRVLVVDARRPARWRDVGASAAKPNAVEAVGLLGEEARDRLGPDGTDRPAAVEDLAGPLLTAAGVDVLAVTLDRDGGVLLHRGHPPTRLPADPAPDDRAAGAGDAFSAALALGLGAGAAPGDAGRLAAHAAACTVAHVGTGVCRAVDLRRALAAARDDAGPDRDVVAAGGGHGGGAPARGRSRTSGPGAQDLPELQRALTAHRTAGRTVAFTNGSFDVLHRGHLAFLDEARGAGDVLVVAVNSDDSHHRLRGAPPQVGLDDRLAVVAALAPVDHLVVLEEPTADALLSTLRPDVYVKGGDWSAEMVPEAETARRLGVELRLLGYEPDHRPAPAAPSRVAPPQTAL